MIPNKISAVVICGKKEKISLMVNLRGDNGESA